MNAQFSVQRRYTHSGGLKNTFGDFTCLHCGGFVPVNAVLSGVHNRNHCPYCLSSRHLDLYEPGDRLSACKQRMVPVGLALKRSASRYPADSRGELMLVHLCQGCGKLTLNRIAADDDSASLLAFVESPVQLDESVLDHMASAGILPLGAAQAPLARVRLYGKGD